MFFFMLLLVMLTLEQSPGIIEGLVTTLEVTTSETLSSVIKTDCFRQSV